MNSIRLRRGFTLIELLVVIAIIGILAALIIVSLSGARARAQDTQRKNNARNLNTALEQAYVDNSGNYPRDGQTTAATPVAIGIDSGQACNSTNGVLNSGTVVFFGSAGYITNTNVCTDSNTAISKWYNTQTTASGVGASADSYVLGWQLGAQTEGTTSSGNGVYQSAGTGNTMTVNTQATTSSTLVPNATKFFVVYGPQ